MVFLHRHEQNILSLYMHSSLNYLTTIEQFLSLWYHVSSIRWWVSCGTRCILLKQIRCCEVMLQSLGVTAWASSGVNLWCVWWCRQACWPYLVPTLDIHLLSKTFLHKTSQFSMHMHIHNYQESMMKARVHQAQVPGSSMGVVPPFL